MTKAAEMSSATPPPETETQESSVRVEPASVAGKDVDATVVVTSIHGQAPVSTVLPSCD